jgi:hypothetical protein
MGTTSWNGAIRTVVDGLWFAEGPRWHDGALWCSDIHGHRVLRVEADGDGDMVTETVVEVPDDEPSGLGWLPDGRLLVVGMQRRLVYRLEADGSLEVHADLSTVARGVLNDMIVSAEGRAYVGDMGLDPNDPDAGVRPGQLLCIQPDGSFSTVADDLGAPNGPALTEDGAHPGPRREQRVPSLGVHRRVGRHLVGALDLCRGPSCANWSRLRAARRHLPGCCGCGLGRRPHRGSRRPASPGW